MSNSHENYNEELELDHYVLTYYSDFMTTLEKLGQQAIFADEKSKNSSGPAAQIVKAKWGHGNNPEVLAALSEGTEAFRRKVRARILSEHKEEVFINRCPKCQKLVKTPKAKMCLWCGESWFQKNS